MSETYTPNPANNPSAYTAPVDGDLKPVASVRVMLEGLADKAAHLDWPESDATKKYPLASRLLTRTVRAAFVPSVPANWTSLLGGAMVQTGGTPTVSGGFQILDLPDGAVLSELRIYIDPIGGHGALPATMPKVQVFRWVPATGVSTSLVSQTDPSASVVAYEALHVITATLGTTETIDNVNNVYAVVFDSEGGANSLNGLQVEGSRAVYTVTSQDPGAA